MKYQHILNNKLLFETNSASDFFHYLMNNPDAKQAKNNILYNLLESNKGYICEMSTTTQE
jgi:hypothetical protein